MSKKQTRHEARIIAFGLIFQKQFNDEEPQFLFEQMLEECYDEEEYPEYRGGMYRKEHWEEDPHYRGGRYGYRMGGRR